MVIFRILLIALIGFLFSAQVVLANGLGRYIFIFASTLALAAISSAITKTILCRVFWGQRASHYISVAIGEVFIMAIVINYFTNLPTKWFFLSSLYPYMSFPAVDFIQNFVRVAIVILSYLPLPWLFNIFLFQRSIPRRVRKALLLAIIFPFYWLILGIFSFNPVWL